MTLEKLQHYMNLYYDGKITKNIELFFLKNPEYTQKYKEISREINLPIDDDFQYTVGYYFENARKHKFYILILDHDVPDSYIIMTLFHELSHIETFPVSSWHYIKKKTKKHSLLGLQFWTEYIAEYEATNQYQMKVKIMNVLQNKQLLDSHMNHILDLARDCGIGVLYEYVLLYEINNCKIDCIHEEMMDLIKSLKNLKQQFISREDMKKITVTQLNALGVNINNLQNRLIEQKML